LIHPLPFQQVFLVKPTPCILKEVDGDLPPKRGRVYQIIDFRQLWLVKPAPTQITDCYIEEGRIY
jgi:hypothetical protein